MKRAIWAVIALVVLGIAAFILVEYFETQSSSADPQKMAQKVANFVARNEGEARFFKGDAFYSVKNRGESNLKITYYLTNRDFPRKGKSTADEVADTLIWGVPELYRELHLSDEGTDGTLDMFQEFSKPGNVQGAWDSFTREERDLGKRAGVKEYLVDKGEILKGNKWVDASEDEKTRIQKEYEFHLAELVELIFP